MHHCQSVHDRHHHVGDDKVGQLLACRLQSLQAIVGSEHRVVMAKDGREEEPQVGIILNDEQRGALSMVSLNVVCHCALLNVGQRKGCVGVVDEIVVGVAIVVEHVIDKGEHALTVAPHHVEQAMPPL